MTITTYCGYRIVRYGLGNSWTIYNTVGHRVGGTFDSSWSAIDYIDKELPCP